MGHAVETDLVLVDVFSRCKAAVIPCANALSSSVPFFTAFVLVPFRERLNERGGYTLTLYTCQWLISKKNWQILHFFFCLSHWKQQQRQDFRQALNLWFHQFTQLYSHLSDGWVDG